MKRIWSQTGGLIDGTVAPFETSASRFLALLALVMISIAMPVLGIAVAVVSVVAITLAAANIRWAAFNPMRLGRSASGAVPSSPLMREPAPPNAPSVIGAATAEGAAALLPREHPWTIELRRPHLEAPRFHWRPPSPGGIARGIVGIREGLRVADVIVVAIVMVGLVLRVHGAFVGGDVADVAAYGGHVHKMKTGGTVYSENNYPYLPGWLMVEVATGRVAEAIRVPFWQAIRMLIVAADVALVFVVWWLATRLGGRTHGRIAAALYALSPIAILVSGNHGMFDSIPILLTVLAAGLAVLGSRRTVLIGILFGLAMTLKPLAVIALPIFLLARGHTFYQRLAVVITAGIVLGIVCLPVFLYDFYALFRNVLGYQGVNDQGISGLLRAIWYERAGNRYLPGDMGRTLSNDTRYIALALMAYSVLVGWRGDLMRLGGATYLAFLATFGAVSTQYLLWPVPFLLMSGYRPTMSVLYAIGATAGALGFYYLFWPPLLFGGSAPPINEWATREFLLGQAIALPLIVICYLYAIAPGLAGGRWKSPIILVGFALTALCAVPAANQVIWLIREWSKLGWPTQF